MYPQQRKVTSQCDGPGNDPSSLGPLFIPFVILTKPKTIRIKFPSKFLSIELQILALAASTAGSSCPPQGSPLHVAKQPSAHGMHKQGANLG